MKTSYIPSLNGLRAICIFMVVSDHLMLHKFIVKTTLTKVLGTVFFNGGLGVGFFFLISGFLITGLLKKENETYGKVSLKNFYLRRSLRIFPAYYCLLAVYYVLQRLGYVHLSTINWIADITYTKQFFQDDVVETTHLWSLSVEEMFYLIWPLIYVEVFSKVSTRYLYALIVLFAVLRFHNYSYPRYMYSNTIISTGDALLIGCLSAIHYNKIASWIINQRKLVMLAFPALIFLIFSEPYAYHLVSLHEHSQKQLFLQKIALPILNSMCGNKGLLTNITIAIIIIYSINVKNLWYKFLNSKLLNYVGLLSYSIYLWQQVFITDKMHRYDWPIVQIIVFVTICSHVSFYLVEKPFLNLKNKLNNIQLFKTEKEEIPVYD